MHHRPGEPAKADARTEVGAWFDCPAGWVPTGEYNVMTGQWGFAAAPPPDRVARVVNVEGSVDIRTADPDHVWCTAAAVNLGLGQVLDLTVPPDRDVSRLAAGPTFLTWRHCDVHFEYRGQRWVVRWDPKEGTKRLRAWPHAPWLAQEAWTPPAAWQDTPLAVVSTVATGETSVTCLDVVVPFAVPVRGERPTEILASCVVPVSQWRGAWASP
jgi:hypothetical protein